MLGKYANITKAISAGIALLATFLLVVVASTSDGVLTVTEWVTIFGALGTLIGGTGVVYQFPNKGGSK